MLRRTYPLSLQRLPAYADFLGRAALSDGDVVNPHRPKRPHGPHCRLQAVKTRLR